MNLMNSTTPGFHVSFALNSDALWTVNSNAFWPSLGRLEVAKNFLVMKSHSCLVLHLECSCTDENIIPLTPR